MNQVIKLFVLACLLLPLSTMAYEQQGSVKRAIVTSGIDNREPSDSLNDKLISAGTNKVYFFTEVLNQANTHITHRWFLNGKLEAEVVLKIGSNRWRTYSSKNLVPTYHSGNWQVEVVDQNGRQLASQNFRYGN